MTRRKRLIALLIVAVSLIGAAALYIEFHFHLPEGSGPAGPAVDLQPFENTWTDRKVLLLGVGDSMTAGFGATRGHSYFERLARNPEDEFKDMRGRSLSRVLPNLQMRNLAVSGSNSLQHLQSLDEKLERQPGDVFGLVVITSGGNDLIHWYGRSAPKEGAMYGATLIQARPWIENYETRLGQMFQLIKDRFPGGCLIFIGDIYDPSDGVGDPESVMMPAWPQVLDVHAAYNDALRQAAARCSWVRVVPICDEFLGHGIHCRQFWRKYYHSRDPHYWYSSNIEDPNDRGYDAIRRLFLNAMVKEIPTLQTR
jgi:lysophospholipase L1-like esterase